MYICVRGFFCCFPMFRNDHSFILWIFSRIWCESNIQTEWNWCESHQEKLTKKQKLSHFIINFDKEEPCVSVSVCLCVRDELWHRVIKANSCDLHADCWTLFNRLMFTHQFRLTNLKWTVFVRVLFASHEKTTTARVEEIQKKLTTKTVSFVVCYDSCVSWGATAKR